MSMNINQSKQRKQIANLLVIQLVSTSVSFSVSRVTITIGQSEMSVSFVTMKWDYYDSQMIKPLVE